MDWPTLIPGTLIKRYKRFLADVELADGTVVTAHCANTGSMLGCKEVGSPVMLSPADSPTRKLRYTWELVRVGEAWVGINTSRPNRIVEEAIKTGRIPELLPYTRLRREVKYGTGSRIDLLLETDTTPIYVEVKNTTLAEGRLARFPDSVTTRGQKHMAELAKVVREGARAAVVFLVHREDVDHFSPADAIDPDYGKALRAAADQGVQVLPYQATVSPERVEVVRRLPVKW